MEKEDLRVANLTKEELERLEQIEEELGYTLVAYENESVSDILNKASQE